MIERRLDNLDKAIQIIEKYIKTRPNHASAHYNLACYLALKGDSEKEALHHLEKATALNPSYLIEAEEDADFDGLRNHPLFRKILDE